MALIMGTITVPGNSTVPAFTMPPGYCNLLLYQPSQAQPVFLGTSARVTSASGIQLSQSPFSTESWVGSGGANWFATTGNVTAATFCYLISSTN
jgi:hypothetical protein